MNQSKNSKIKTVLILTMPRSGSSLLAGVLHRLGISMGEDKGLKKGKHLNKYGCYENQTFQSISLNALFEAGILLDITNRMDIDENRLKNCIKKYEDRIINFIEENQSEIWGFKDPALLYLIPHIYHLFENPFYIHLKRDEKDTGGSLYKTSRFSYWLPELREKWPLFSKKNRGKLILRAIKLLFKKNKEYKDKEFYRKVVRKGHERIDNFLEEKNFYSLTFEDLLHSPRESISGILGFLQINPDENRIKSAVDFIRPDLPDKY
ncbi:MAG: sulfotransferase [Elusimicrobiota bacterium]